MTEKPKAPKTISLRETFVLDDEDMQELHNASLAGIMRDLTTIKQQIPDDLQD